MIRCAYATPSNINALSHVPHSWLLDAKMQGKQRSTEHHLCYASAQLLLTFASALILCGSWSPDCPRDHILLIQLIFHKLNSCHFLLVLPMQGYPHIQLWCHLVFGFSVKLPFCLRCKAQQHDALLSPFRCNKLAIINSLSIVAQQVHTARFNRKNGEHNDELHIAIRSGRYMSRSHRTSHLDTVGSRWPQPLEAQRDLSRPTACLPRPGDSAAW